MNFFCSKCGIDWASLWSSDQGDEQYEVCPQCGTDMFLEPGASVTGNIKCPVTGKITNIKTKQVMNIPGPVYIPKLTKSLPALVATHAEIERRETAAIEAYHESGNPEDYFTSFKNESES